MILEVQVFCPERMEQGLGEAESWTTGIVEGEGLAEGTGVGVGESVPIPLTNKLLSKVPPE